MKSFSKTLFMALILLVAIVSCEKESESISGKYKYTLISEGDGPMLMDGEYIIADLKGIDNNDSVWFDRTATVSPISLRKDSAKWVAGEDGLYEIFYYSKKGDSLSVTVTIADFFENTVRAPMPPQAEKVETITLYWKVAEVLNYEDYFNYMTELQNRLDEEYNQEETAIIQDYLTINGWEDSQVSPNGVYVIIHEEGEGPLAQAGQRVFADYSGYLLDGTFFDGSVEEIAKENKQYNPGRVYEPYSFILANDQVIQGWHEGFALLNKGAKATFIIPSSLGYQGRGNGIIPPYASLRFDVTLVDVQ